MLNLDEDENITTINDLIGKDVRLGLRRFVKLEVKTDKHELRILCLCDNKTYLISIKNNKPYKIEASFHFLEIKRLESLSKSQLIIVTNDLKEHKLKSTNDNETDLDDSGDLDSIDDIISFYCSSLLLVFPAVTIKDIFEVVNIQPEKRLQLIYNEILEFKNLKKKNQICGCYSKAYLLNCSLVGCNPFQEVVWDINLIYGQNSLNEFCLNDFDYVNPKDYIPLIAALKYNSWFEGFKCDSIKFTNEMQEELIKVLTVPVCKIQNLTLISTHLKHDFVQRLLQAYQSSKSNKRPSLSEFKSINLSRNTSLEDKGIIYLANIFKEFSKLCNLSNLVLSRCNITSKSLNIFFSSAPLLSSTLTSLDLSFNSLKEEPVELYKYLAESNELQELNLAYCELDVDKLFNALSRGGCDKNLRKLILNGNHTFSKMNIIDNFMKFLKSTKSLSYFDLSNCKLSGVIVQIILASSKQNLNLANNGTFYLNLSSNDLGSCLKQFMYELNFQTCITSLDLSENNLDTDTDILISQIESTKIKSLSLSRNFHYSKSKVVTKIVQALTKLTLSKYSHLQNLWLVDCKLKSHLNDFINELGSFSQLRFLDITGNEIGDQGFTYLSKSLQVNRSLQTLLFDKSNVTVQSYVNIIESLKRNFTLKSLQMPMNDICNLYQKSPPEKVIDIVKQMSELFSQRNLLLNSQNKCDLDQLFKTKMKLINEPILTPQSTLNTSSSSKSNNRVDETEEFKQNLDSINSPHHIREILQNLNETASNYLNNKPIEEEFSKFSTQILEKIDDVALSLENELHSALTKKYPKYAASLPYSHSNSKFNKDNEDLTLSETVKLTSLKNNIKEYMNSMLVQIHNDICEMTYKLSTTMAEKLINEAQHIQAVEQSEAKLASTSSTTRCSNSHENSQQPHLHHHQQQPNQHQSQQTQPTTLSKKIPGGIKLPFMAQLSSSLSASNSNENDLLNSSKSKRPISSQPADHLANGQASHEAKKNSTKHVKSASSSSNEHLVDIGSDDELETAKTTKNKSNSSSREKTPDRDEAKPAMNANNNKTATSSSSDLGTSSPSASLNRSKSPLENKPSAETVVDEVKPLETTPIPAPRKPKTNPLKSIFRNVGVGSPATPTSNKEAPTPTTTPSILSPKLARKVNIASFVDTQPVLTPHKPSQEAVLDELTVNINNENADTPAQLNHLNKARAKRANVKRPTVKYPHSNIEVETVAEDLNVLASTRPDVEVSKQDPLPAKTTTQNELSQEVNEPKRTSPLANKSNQMPEQPKMSMNILEGVKLRQINKPKIVESEVQNSEETQTNPAVYNNGQIIPTSTTPTVSTKLANRVSMFEQSLTASKPSSNTKPKLDVNQENNEENTNAQETPIITSNKTKPLPPIPSKPARPLFNQQNSNNNNNNTNNSNTKLNLFNKDESTGQPFTFKLRPVNGSNKDNGENSTSSNTDNDKPEKRTSVKEMAQMLNEESKA